MGIVNPFESSELQGVEKLSRKDTFKNSEYIDGRFAKDKLVKKLNNKMLDFAPKTTRSL